VATNGIGFSANCRRSYEQKENSRLYDSPGVLRSARSVANFRLVPSSLRISGERLLDTYFVKRLSGFSDRAVTSLLIIPALIGIAGMLTNGWHSDKMAERRLHSAIPLLIAGGMYGLLIPARHDFPLAMSFLLLGSGLYYASYPVFWSIPTMILSESAAAATFGLINSVAQLGGFAGPYVIGFLNDRTHSLIASFGFIALAFTAAGSVILGLRIRDPIQALGGSKLD
jgi:predicted MFS family arabinose efflux permease